MIFTAGSPQGIKLVFHARPGICDFYEVFTPGHQFSYLTPPPASKRTSGSGSPQDQPRLPYYYSKPSPSPPYRDQKYFSPPQTSGNNVEDDSGFESLVTNVSDSGGQSSSRNGLLVYPICNITNKLTDKILSFLFILNLKRVRYFPLFY